MGVAMHSCWTAPNCVQRYGSYPLQASCENVAVPTRSERAAFALLNSCVLLYLITQWPVFLYGMLHLLEKACVLQVGMAAKKVVLPIINVPFKVNFSTDFLVYCGADSKFRAGLCSACSAVSEGVTRWQSRLSEPSNGLVPG